MVKRTRTLGGFMAVVVLLMPLVGCTGSDSADETDQASGAGDAVVGSFVGKLPGTEAFVAVVAAPTEGGKGAGAVQVHVSDGSGLNQSFSGPISDNSFVAKSDEGDAEAKGKLAADSVTGTVVLPGGKTVEFDARPPSGGAGVYELTLSPAGELSGVSAAGLAVSGEVTLGKRGTGLLRLVDGTRLELALTRKRAGALAHLRAGQVRLIVLSDGELRGAAKGGPPNGGRFDFFIRSA